MALIHLVLRLLGSTFSRPLSIPSRHLLAKLASQTTNILMPPKQKLQIKNQWRNLQFVSRGGGGAYLWWLASVAGYCALSTRRQGWLRQA